MAQAMAFGDQDVIGRVTAVDTSKVYIRVDDHDVLKRVMVGQLLSIQGPTGHEFLIAIVDRITRLPSETFAAETPMADDTMPVPDPLRDTIRAILVGTYRTKTGDKGPSFKRGADACPQIDQPSYLVEKANLGHFMGVLSKDVADNEALRLGRFVLDRDALAVADGDRFFQRHAAILGSTGSGKSWTVALLLERAKGLTHPNIIVLDIHGEYKPLSSGPDAYAQPFRIAGPADLKSPAQEVLFLPYWLLNREEMLALILDRDDQNAPNQATRFTTLVREGKMAYLEQSGKPDVASTFTVDSPIPYSLDKLTEELKASDREMVPGANREKQGEWHGKLTRFISRLEAKVDDRRYGFMFAPPADATKYDWLSDLAVKLLDSGDANPGIKIVDFSEVPTDVLPIVVSVLARLLYDVQFWMEASRRTPICFVCDEAHLYLPVKDDADAALRRALGSFERIAKEGRKYGVALLVVSQRPSDVSRTILSQCNNFIAMRLTNEQDQAAVKSVMPDSMAGIADILPLLDVGEAIVLGDAILLPSRVRLEKPSLRPHSATRNFWQDWRTQAPDSDAIKKAVESLRRQSRS